MNKEHLSDPELQEYALHSENCPPQFNVHIQSCNFCSQKAELYQLIFSSGMTPEAPMFDFDLTETVMQRLPEPQPAALEKSYIIYWVGAGVFLGAGVLVYLLFMTSTGFLFDKLTPMTLGFSITTFLAIFAVLGIDIFQKHTKQLKVLQSELQQFGSLSV